MPEALPDILARAARNGEVLRIIYHGGSQPGTVREVVPIWIGETKIRARDLASHKDKLFALEKIELSDESARNPEYTPVSNEDPEPTCPIGEALKEKVSELEGLGWRVDLLKDSIALYAGSDERHTQKGPAVRLDYDKPSTDRVVAVVISLEGVTVEEREEEQRGSRPFRVYSRRLEENQQFGSMRYFGRMSSAIFTFLSEARALAPSGQPPAPQ